MSTTTNISSWNDILGVLLFANNIEVGNDKPYELSLGILWYSSKIIQNTINLKITTQNKT